MEDANALPAQWSLSRESELVLRLLQGEPLDVVSRDSRVPAHELETWRRVFLAAGARGLQRHVASKEPERSGTPKEIRELMMRLELADELIEKKGLVEKWKKRASFPTPEGFQESR